MVNSQVIALVLQLYLLMKVSTVCITMIMVKNLYTAYGQLYLTLSVGAPEDRNRLCGQKINLLLE